MPALLLAFLTLEHLAVGIPLILLRVAVTLLEMWQASIYRRIDVMTEKVRK